jgi:hypothetical protein
LEFWSGTAADVRAPFEDVEHARAIVAQLQEEMHSAQHTHVSRNVEEKYRWLSAQRDPLLSQLAEDIKSFLNSQKDMLSFTGGASHTKHRHFDDNAYMDVKDMRALDWLVSYVVSRQGHVTFAHVLMWRSRRMSKGQQPADAFAALKEEGEILEFLSIRHSQFFVDRELLNMVSKPDVGDGQSFWPSGLLGPLQQAMLAVTFANPVLESDPAALAKLWVDTATHLWDDLLNRDPAKIAAISQELNRRGDWKSWTALQAAYTQAAVDQETSPQPSQARQVVGRQVKGAWSGQPSVCNHCGASGHRANECPHLGGQMRAQGSPTPARVATTTPTAGTNQLSVGMNPKAAYNRPQGSPAAPSAPAVRKNYPQCMECSRITGKPHHHMDPCFLKIPIHEVPAWYNPPNALLRAAVNDRRQRANLPIPPPPPPNMAGMSGQVVPSQDQRKARFSDEYDQKKTRRSSMAFPRAGMM